MSAWQRITLTTPAGNRTQAPSPGETTMSVAPWVEPKASRRLKSRFLVHSYLRSFAGGLFSKAAVLATTLIVARSLSPQNFGRYIGLWAGSILAASCWDIGLSTLFTREYASGAVGLADGLRRSAILRVATLPVWAFVFFGAVFAMSGTRESTTWATLSFAGASLCYGLSLLFLAVLRARLRFLSLEGAVAAGRLVTAILSLVGVCLRWPGDKLVFFGFAVLIGEAVTALVAANLLRFGAVRNRNPSACSPLTISAALPFAANSVMILAYNRFDVVLVGALTSAREAGMYAAASRIQDAFLLIPGALMIIGFPVFGRVWRESESVDAVSDVLLRLAAGGFLLVAVATVLALALMSGLLALILPAYLPAVLPTQIILCTLPLNSVTGLLVSALGATGRAKDGTKVIGATLLVALVAHLCLDPSRGAIGGAIATALRDPAGLIVAGVFAKRAGLLRASESTLRLRWTRSRIGSRHAQDGRPV
jgi:O-antigen/teichoic acid export membrane protein